jgi:uncharacterized glyoxalase superfamily protein PhnB
MNCIPFLAYDDARAALEWLERALGFERGDVHESPQGKVAHAEMRYEGGMVMLGTAGPNNWGQKTPRELAGVNQGVYVIVEDIDSHYERTRGAGAEIVRPLADTDYGSREYMARDPEGNVWSVGTYRPSEG